MTDNKYDNLTASFSDDNSKIVFISYRNGGIGQVFVADADGKNIKQITVSETIRKQLPVFSPNGKIIAFTVFPSDVKTFLPEDQKIYITDLDGNERFLTNGAHPMFLPGDKFVLVLKNDGLYMVSVENGVSSVVIKGGSAFTTMKLAFSKNRNMLVWTNFPNEVLIFKLSWDSSSGYLNHFLYKKILAGAFWAVFSPDGRYLAIQEAKNGNPPARARIVVYDLKTFEWEEIIDLGSYKQTAMWMTAWQSR